MAHYQIVVQWKSGEPATGRRVSLCGTGLLGGFSKDFYTDRGGRAVIEMSSGGEVTVYVDGSDRGRTRPGTYLVTIG